MADAKRYDVIVIGLGPGGSSAAYELAQFGRKVLGLEKYHMPRTKPCGGCLSAKIQTILDDDLPALAEEEITRVILSFRGQSEITITSEKPIAWMVMREQFDFHLAEKARQAGAQVHYGEPVLSIERTGLGFRVQTSKGEYFSKFLVGADGVNGLTSRALGYAPSRQIAVALEGEIALTPATHRTLQHTVRLDIGDIPYGYGWLFPKEKNWSVGVGTVQQPDLHPRKYYASLLRNQHIEQDIIDERSRGYRIPLFSGRSAEISRDGSLLVGDAAALVDPFLGEGIYYAIRSGQIAAETIHKALHEQTRNLDAYRQHIAEEIWPEFEAAARIARFAFQFPRLSYAVFMAHQEMACSFVKILQGSLSYREYWKKLNEFGQYGLFGFLRLLKTGKNRGAQRYDRLAHQYDALRFVWQETMAREGTTYYHSLLREHVRDGAAVLDAGTGTGEEISFLLKATHPLHVTGLDLSAKMLEKARQKNPQPNVSFRQGDMLALPFAENSFDVVMSSWAIETCADPRKAVSEFLRVVKEDGYVIYIFSSLPKGLKRLYARTVELFLLGKFNWHFLNKRTQPYHECGFSSMTTFADGLITVVVLRKCCRVSETGLPCALPQSWNLSGELTTDN